MDTLSNHFTRAAVQYTGISIFSLLLLAIAIIDDKERAENRQQEKRDRFTKSQRNPLAGPKPF